MLDLGESGDHRQRAAAGKGEGVSERQAAAGGEAGARGHLGSAAC